MNDNWQPIETAPTYGCDVLLLGQDGMAVACWDDYDKGWISDLRGKGNGQEVYYPTHWMPLPNPPTEGTET